MKKIKELLKRLSILDFLLIAVFAFLLLFFIIIFSRSNKNIELRVKVTDPNVLYMGAQPSNEYAFSFKRGDVERNEVGQVVAEMVDIDRYITSSTNQTIYLTLNVKANYNPLQKRYSIKGRPIVFGQSLTFTFTNVKFDALVVGFPGYVQEKIPVTLLIKSQFRADNRSFSDVYGVPLFFKSVVQKGDVVLDKNGQTIIEITNVSTQPAKRTIVDDNNRSINILDQELVDIYYDIKINAYEIGGKFFIYDFYPIEIGGSVPVVLKNVSVWPTIISIEEEK